MYCGSLPSTIVLYFKSVDKKATKKGRPYRLHIWYYCKQTSSYYNYVFSYSFKKGKNHPVWFIIMLVLSFLAIRTTLNKHKYKSYQVFDHLWPMQMVSCLYECKWYLVYMNQICIDKTLFYSLDKTQFYSHQKL